MLHPPGRMRLRQGRGDTQAVYDVAVQQGAAERRREEWRELHRVGFLGCGYTVWCEAGQWAFVWRVEDAVCGTLAGWGTDVGYFWGGDDWDGGCLYVGGEVGRGKMGWEVGGCCSFIASVVSSSVFLLPFQGDQFSSGRFIVLSDLPVE